MPAVSNLALPDTLVDLDAPPPVEFPLPAPFAHVVNPVNALPFARGEDLVALGIYKFSRSVLSDFNLTDNVNRDIMKNVNFSAIYNEAGEVVDHAVPPVAEALMQLELRGEVTIQDLRMTARDYGDIVVDITVESHAPALPRGATSSASLCRRRASSSRRTWRCRTCGLAERAPAQVEVLLHLF